MRLVPAYFRFGRALGALLLLAAFVAGEAADTRHHLAERGCAAESGGRDDNCTCAGLQALSLAGDAPPQAAPLEFPSRFVCAPVALAPTRSPVVHAAPRAPPRG